MPSHYVRREKDSRVGWIGPIRSPGQAEREVAAWVDAGWLAQAFTSTPDIRAQVDAWQRSKRQ